MENADILSHLTKDSLSLQTSIFWTNENSWHVRPFLKFIPPQLYKTIRWTYERSKFPNHSWPTRHHPFVDPVDPVDRVEPVDPGESVEQVEPVKFEFVQLVQLDENFSQPRRRRTRNAVVWVGSAYEALKILWKHWCCLMLPICLFRYPMLSAGRADVWTIYSSQSTNRANPGPPNC